MSKERSQRNINIFLFLMFIPGIFALGWSVYFFERHVITPGLIALSIFTIFFSSAIKFQLPRTKIHLTISDVLIFLSMFLYGGNVAVILVMFETIFTSFMLRRNGVKMGAKTITINTLIATVSVFGTYITTQMIFGSPELVLIDAAATHLASVLFVIGMTQFALNSLLVSAYVSIRNTQDTLWRVWNEYCLNALVMFLFGVIVAGLVMKALQQIDLFLFIIVAVIFSLVYTTYSRYVNDIKKTAAEAQEAERLRAEQAEEHVVELEHYVGELKKSGEALAESRERFKYAAYHDDLTGLPNRLYLLEKINIILNDKIERQENLAVIFLDLNRFKTVNDSLGHSVGDELLRRVAIRLKEVIGSEGSVSRFGGDEFAILINTQLTEDGVNNLALSVRQHLAKPFWVNDRKLFTNASIGIAFQDENYGMGEDLLRNADIAMYHAKKVLSGIVIFDSQMHTSAVSALQLEIDMRAAIKEKQFHVFYQPIIDLASAKISGFEALVRWQHPKRGLVPPNDFIPLAESTGQIIPITIQILQDACYQQKKWLDLMGEQYTVSVNLSGKHFEHPDLVEQVEEILNETKIDPRYLKLEITESAVMQNAESAVETLFRIKQTGIKISMDDFGTGYSSLNYLHKFPIDTLKIDRSFVSLMEEGNENGEIINTIMALAHALNLDVVAEGIETAEQFYKLKHLGCEYGQGYLFSKPLPIAEIDKLLWSTLPWRNILPTTDYENIDQNNVFH